MSDVGEFDAGVVQMDVIEATGPVAVIGDIHGRADLLARLLAQLGEMPVFVVGDVCDRGPDTREVIEQLVARGARGVRGNHEDWLCQFVDGRGFDSVALNAMFGGAATLRSYVRLSTAYQSKTADGVRRKASASCHRPGELAA